MDTMACGSIIVSHLYEKLQIDKLDIPHEILDIDQDHLEEMDDHTLLNQCILLWNGLETYFGFYNRSIHYEKDNTAAEMYFQVAGKYYVCFYNHLMNRFNKRLNACRKESSEYTWSVNLIQIYSEYYLMRQNLMSHIRYLYKINPKIIGLEKGMSITIDTKLVEPKEYHPVEKSKFNKILDIGIYFLWYMSNI